MSGGNSLLASLQELTIMTFRPASIGPLLVLTIILASGGPGCVRAAVAVATTAPGQAHTSNNQTSGSGGRPYWHKPGCHQVGHTRTISIPGCVKFNLSTNACRGFCMSFSIPATEDIGPPPPPILAPDGHLDGLTGESAGPVAGATPTTMPPMIEVGGTMDSQQLASMISGQVNGQPLIITRRMAREYGQGDKEAATAAATAMTQKQSAGGNGGLRMSEFLHLAGQTKSPLAGAVGDLSDRRDVISVSQCCNMMETEDVTINLRCGLNETRKLVFKSAKTCECFFCKHL